jgi:hypothetical protein
MHQGDDDNEIPAAVLEADAGKYTLFCFAFA